MLLSVTVVLPGVSGADEKISGRFVYHLLKWETVEVGDVPGHITGITQNAGLVFDSNGEIATHTGTATYDYVNGTGTHTAHRVYIYSDGSKKFVKSIGTTTRVDGEKRAPTRARMNTPGGQEGLNESWEKAPIRGNASEMRNPAPTHTSTSPAPNGRSSNTGSFMEQDGAFGFRPLTLEPLPNRHDSSM